ncbi:mechanosensitive ion channel family protein [Microvirga sp. TS319]|uniref:mechanosensitive ion channel family protein n=1 Tax=Microvirga sp. TS319 TaxID=3241165 RepID=UPI00351A0D98
MAALVLIHVDGPALAQAPRASAPPPAQVDELLRLLEDPAIRQWIDQQRRPPPPPGETAQTATLSEALGMRIAAIRRQFIDLMSAIPRLPEEARQGAELLTAELQSRSLLNILLLVFGFLCLGIGLERIFIKATARARERLLSSSGDTVNGRVKAIGMRLALGLTYVAIFGIGSIGAFLIFDWPLLLRRIVLAYLAAALLLRLARLVTRILLAPGGAWRVASRRFRVIPLADREARFWYRRAMLFIGWFVFGWATVETARNLGFSFDGRRVVAYFLGIGLLAIALEVVWRRPVSSQVAANPERPARHHHLGSWLLSIYLVLLWGFWVAGLMGIFWLSTVAVILPQAVTITRLSVRNLLHPQGSEELSAEHEMNAVYLDRGIRALLIAGAALFLAWVWQIDLVELTSRDTAVTRLVRGVLSSLVILLLADFVWQVVKTQIDRRLSRIQATTVPGSEEALKQARLLTLLPIFRMTAFIVLAVVAVLMALSSLGVEIAPLIAGAGIFGVAVGFGSQALVRDVISGIFYLLDDAFRVGEYVQSGSYKGTVESLGFRSVKLRHHRGPIFTVPYGQLGAVENMSRDWVIDKLSINVTYDTDLDLTKKIIKQVGKNLASDPEFAPHIIEPLKMQGVEQFGDFAIQIRLKMMTRPGEQFAVRRRALANLKKAFDENGIQFAFPTVQVAGRGESEPAAAQHALKLVKGTPPE